MDLIGGPTSLSTQVDGVFKTIIGIKNLTQSYQDAPAELGDLRLRLETLSIHLLLLRDVQAEVYNNPIALDLGSDQFNLLIRSLHATRITFTEILAFFEQKSSGKGRSARIRWVLGDASKVKSWDLRLQRHGELLQTTLIFLNR